MKNRCDIHYTFLWPKCPAFRGSRQPPRELSRRPKTWFTAAVSRHMGRTQNISEPAIKKAKIHQCSQQNHVDVTGNLAYQMHSHLTFFKATSFQGRCLWRTALKHSMPWPVRCFVERTQTPRFSGDLVGRIISHQTQQISNRIRTSDVKSSNCLLVCVFGFCLTRKPTVTGFCSTKPCQTYSSSGAAHDKATRLLAPADPVKDVNISSGARSSRSPTKDFLLAGIAEELIAEVSHNIRAVLVAVECCRCYEYQ